MRVVGVVSLLLLLLSACAPGAAPAIPTLPTLSGAAGAPAGATQRVVLPSGEVCGYAEPGATFSFGNERLAWTCAVAPEGPRGLLGTPAVVNDVEVVVRLVSTARRADGAGFAPTTETPIRARVMNFTTSEGAACAFVGEGATLSFAGRRVNYSCLRDDVALGAFRADARGLSVEVGTLVRGANGWVLTRARWVRVAQITLAPAVAAVPAAASDAAATASDATASADAVTEPADVDTSVTDERLPASPVDAVRVPGVVVLSPEVASSTASDAAPEVVSVPRLFGTVWRLVRASGPEGVWEVEEPARYTLQLLADGQALAQFDCNRGVAQFDLRADALAFAPWATTRVVCAPGSRGEFVSQGLASVRAYRLEAGGLLLLGSTAGVVWRFEAANAAP